jgi:hypothetical protein
MCGGDEDDKRRIGKLKLYNIRGYQRGSPVSTDHIEQLHAHHDTSSAVSPEFPAHPFCRILGVASLRCVQNHHSVNDDDIVGVLVD